jgi:hypothetical protein
VLSGAAPISTCSFWQVKGEVGVQNIVALIVDEAVSEPVSLSVMVSSGTIAWGWMVYIMRRLTEKVSS